MEHYLSMRHPHIRIELTSFFEIFLDIYKNISMIFIPQKSVFIPQKKRVQLENLVWNSHTKPYRQKKKKKTEFFCEP